MLDPDIYKCHDFRIFCEERPAEEANGLLAVKGLRGRECRGYANAAS